MNGLWCVEGVRVLENEVLTLKAKLVSTVEICENSRRERG